MTPFGDSAHPGDRLDIGLLASFREKADFCMLKQGVHRLILGSCPHRSWEMVGHWSCLPKCCLFIAVAPRVPGKAFLG